jgi:hypothetical protein
MNDNENLVLDEGTENVEATATEEMVEQVAEPEKVYTEEEFNNKLNEVTGKRDARTLAKVQKKYDRKYGGLIDVLKAGTGIEDVDELTNTFKDFYSKKGVEFATEPTYSAKETEVLAKADADEIINLGYEDVVEEINRYADIGVENLNAREKATLKILAEYQDKTERVKELSKIGVSADVYDSKEFKDFAKQFVSNTPITEIYKIYNQTQPKKQIKPMGSIKSTTVDNGAVKDFYTKEEAMKFTREDFDKNPALFEAVEKSMRKWK